MKTSILLFAFLLVGALACKKEDPCDNITCLNGGTCANGACNCPPGYEGSDCSLRIVPSSITIKKISVTDFPPLQPNGESWDVQSLFPDLFVRLYQGNNLIASNFSDVVMEGVIPPVTWENLSDFILYKSPEQCCIELVDLDDFSGTGTTLGGICFNPFDESNNDNFPETVPLSCNGCTVAFSLAVDYDF